MQDYAHISDLKVLTLKQECSQNVKLKDCLVGPYGLLVTHHQQNNSLLPGTKFQQGLKMLEEMT